MEVVETCNLPALKFGSRLKGDRCYCREKEFQAVGSGGSEWKYTEGVPEAQTEIPIKSSDWQSRRKTHDHGCHRIAPYLRE